jgi:predicted ATP-dependent protease
MTATGRSKVILVNNDSGNPVGILSEVVALPTSNNEEGRLALRGPVKFKEEIRNHLNSIVLPLVDRIIDGLGLSRQSYEVSITNIGAAASSGVGIEISGFSADLPVFLALLSASLRVGLRQDMASTGHIASLDGDIAAVRGIPAKLAAVLKYPGITGLVIPDFEQDSSLKLLTPLEYNAVKESLLLHRGETKIHPIKDVHGALKIFMTSESIVKGSLLTGFFPTRNCTHTL